MFKKNYIRAGRSIEEILVRRKIEHQEKTSKNVDLVLLSNSAPAGILPPLLRSSNEYPAPTEASVADSPAQLEIEWLNNVARKSMHPNSNKRQQTQRSNPNSQLSTNSTPVIQPIYDSLHQSQHNASRTCLIPPSYPYPHLDDRVRDKEKQAMMAALITEYNTLSSRVQELEAIISAREVEAKIKRKKQLREQQHKLIQDYLDAGYTLDQLMEMFPAMSRALSSRKQIAEPEIDVAALDLNEKVNRVDHRITYLQKVFRTGSVAEKKNKAAIKIQKIMRGAIVRTRMHKFRKSLQDWRTHRMRWVSIVVEQMLALQTKKVARLEQLQHNQHAHWLKIVFSKWMSVTKQFLTLRRYVRRRANELIVAKQVQLMRFVFHQFVEVTVGELSVRGVNKKRALLVESIRNEICSRLVRRGEIGVVPKYEVEKVLYRCVLLQFLEGKRMLVIKRLFQRIKLLRSMAIKFNECATNWWFRKRAGSCFYSWSDYTYKMRSHHNRKRWLAPRHYELPYSQRQVDMFARKRAILYAFRPWKKFHIVRMKVNRLFNAKQRAFKIKMFNIFKEEVRANRKYRLTVIENWKGYANWITSKPFRAWKEYVDAVRNKHNEQAQIVDAYCRWKQRSYILLILRTWRHQAVFGRVVGMYPITKLLKSLSDQKSHAVGLQKRISGETVALEELNTNLAKEINKTRELETRMTMLGLDVNRQKMIVHHSQQEVSRLETIIEAIAIINPHQVEHLKLLDPTFVLKEVSTPSVSLSDIAEANTANGPILADDSDMDQIDTNAQSTTEPTISPTVRMGRKSGFSRSESGQTSTKSRSTVRRDRIATEQLIQKKVEQSMEMVKRTRWLLTRLEEQAIEKAMEDARIAITEAEAAQNADTLDSPVSPGRTNFTDPVGSNTLLAPPDNDVASWAFAYDRQEFYYVEGKREGKAIRVVSPDHLHDEDRILRKKTIGPGNDDECDSDEENLAEDRKEDSDYASNLFAHRTSLTRTHGSAVAKSTSGRLSYIRSPNANPHATHMENHISSPGLTRGRDTVVMGGVSQHSPSMLSTRPLPRQSILQPVTGPPPGTIPFIGSHSPASPTPTPGAFSRNSSGRVPSFISRGNSLKENGNFSTLSQKAPDHMAPLLKSFSTKSKTSHKPIDPTEEIIELEGTGAKTLLAVLDFIMHGESSGFVEEDKRAWKHVIDPSPPPSPPLPEDETFDERLYSGASSPGNIGGFREDNEGMEPKKLSFGVVGTEIEPVQQHAVQVLLSESTTPLVNPDVIKPAVPALSSATVSRQSSNTEQLPSTVSRKSAAVPDRSPSLSRAISRQTSNTDQSPSTSIPPPPAATLINRQLSEKKQSPSPSRRGSNVSTGDNVEQHLGIKSVLTNNGPGGGIGRTDSGGSLHSVGAGVWMDGAAAGTPPKPAAATTTATTTTTTTTTAPTTAPTIPVSNIPSASNTSSANASQESSYAPATKSQTSTQLQSSKIASNMMDDKSLSDGSNGSRSVVSTGRTGSIESILSNKLPISSSVNPDYGFSRKESGGSMMSSVKSLWIDDDEEEEMKRTARKEAKRKAREDRIIAEKMKEEAKLKPKSWFQLVDSLRRNRPGPGTVFHAADVEANASHPNILIKFTALGNVRENMQRVLQWEEWKKVHGVPNRRRKKKPWQLEEETRIAQEEDTSDEDNIDEEEMYTSEKKKTVIQVNYSKSGKFP